MCSAPFDIMYPYVSPSPQHARQFPAEEVQPVTELRGRIGPSEIVVNRAAPRPQKGRQRRQPSRKRHRISTRRTVPDLQEVSHVAKPPAAAHTDAIRRLRHDATRRFKLDEQSRKVDT